MIKAFKKYLEEKDFTKNTISNYLFTLKQYKKLFGLKKITKKNLQDYKIWLIENFKPKTVNLRICGINSYLEFIKQEKLKLSSVKVQQKSFLENVISEADYEYFKNSLFNDNNKFWYFVVRYLCATGARISEFVQIKVEHIQKGYFDIYSKGGKVRRIFIPQKLQEETLLWFEETYPEAELVVNMGDFVNDCTNEEWQDYSKAFGKYNNKLTPRSINYKLKALAQKYGLNTAVVYPHSFRHRFAKSFLDRYNDIALLADLMGHESLETTRVYLRRTSSEQQFIVNKYIDW